jgi:flagellar assembly protein FliH
MNEAVNEKIQDYVFQDLTASAIDNPDEIQEYSLEEFQDRPRENKEFVKVIKAESHAASDKQFRISPIVKKHRGIADQEREDQQRRIEDLVEKKFSLVEEDAYKLGYEKGLEKGREEIYQQLRGEVDEKLNILMEMVNEVLALKTSLIENQRLEIYTLVKNLTKWITLKELEHDDNYLERLLNRLIHEIETKDNLLIQVNKNHFDSMPKVLERVEERLGELKNVRVEVDYDIADQGLIIESENGIINASMEEQFQSLDKLFESVGVKTDDE